MSEFEGSDYRELTLEDIFRMFKKRMVLFISIVLAVVVVTGVYLIFATPIYEASVTIKVDPTSQSSVGDLFSSSLTGSSGSNISTEVELIKSRTNIEEIIEVLGLVDRVYSEDTKARLLSEGYSDRDLVASLTRSISSMITVSPVKDTRIVRVSVQNKDPVLARDIANTLAEVYNTKLAELSKRDLTRKREFIEAQIPLLESDLNEATDKIKQFKEETGIYVLDKHADQLFQMLSNYDKQHNELMISAEEKKAEIETYQSMLDDFDSIDSKSIKALWVQTSESFSVNPVLTSLRQSLATLQVELASLEEQYPKTDPRVRSKITEISKTESLIAEQIQNEFIVSGQGMTLNPAYQQIITGVISSEAGFQILQASIQAVGLLRDQYQSELRNLPAKEQQLLDLERQIAVKESLYTLLLERLEEAKISEAAVVGNAAIVDPATVPQSPVKPNKKLSLAIGGVLGIFLGMLMVFLAEYLDKTLKTEEEIERFSRQPIIGRIPSIEGTSEEMYVEKNPTAPSSESIKLAASNLSFTMGEGKTVAVTSVLPTEGKSFVIANIAYSMANSGQRVVLLDLDLRRPRVEKILKAGKRTKGAVDVIMGTASIDDVVENYAENMDFIGVGIIPPNPTIVLSSKRIDTLLSELKQRYDRVLIDMPPAVVTSDVSLVGNKLDGIVLVVRPGRAIKDGLRIVVENLKTVGVKILGVIVNGVDEKNSSYYYHYYYYYNEEGKRKKRRKRTSK
ncbi:capsular biosynthesis protein [Mesotoga sp. Brook.08.YT.4.2.5.1]|uniref:GumC family protein n=1 Tax=unclassified Mesotoga TaxID=1184398 RepID=UPI000C1912DF|nr:MULTISPECIES: polysaccharide biosynthesis tyrosine autokinase [unclassified Mesotoga]PNE23189.1 capsular biosynthesis protein [Mesotoga sp. Brook.08.YT.4.2.5.1]PNS42249.1 capsular biosynthesis protein [Mesotoga sp. B105.6.4]PVD15722.1 capsular polysaccharide biosynthesis protein [Mesotoga sp. Brook.08.105.5.1]RAO97744.1 capsular polysaccharide biosynthesis protein [Mesotoga sp. Brook.08.YT.4.2.5.4.]RDI93762.1 capsular biosynthesis protein [Mesotoga sp. Brook.08.YT.4.2.5.2.]